MVLNYRFNKLHLALSCLVLTSSAFADNIFQTFSPFPWPPRLTVELASVSNTFGAADAMLPMFGRDNQSVYIDLGGKYGDDRARLGSVGLGTRYIWRNTIFGGYFFSDYNRTPDTHHFNVLNPGLEFMTPLWDGHLNGYFPRGDRRVDLDILTGTELGRNNSIYFSGHSQFERLFDLIEEVGPGADIQLGYTAPNAAWTRTFAGAYHFSPKYTPVVNGVAVGFETPLKFNWAELKIQDSYDNLEGNTFLVSLQLTLGGLNKIGSFDVHDRMLDLIPRHISNLRTGDGIPSQKKVINRNKNLLLDTNIWFFNQDGASFGDLNPNTTFESCTFEHPCIGLSQARIDAINNLSSAAKLYLSSGTYNNINLGDAFTLRPGQSIWGRFPGFAQPAVGNMRPLLNDSLFLEGNNQVHDITVQGQSMRPLSTGGQIFPFQVGVLLRSYAIGDASIFNSDFSVLSSVNSIAGAVNNSDTYTLNLLNDNITTIATNATDTSQNVNVGVGNLRTGNLNIVNSSIKTQTFNDVQQFNVTFGLVNNEAGQVNINGSVIVVNVDNGGFASGVLNNSSLGLGLGTINIYRSSISNISNNTQLVGGVFNQANNLLGISAPINIVESNINVVNNTNIPFATTAGVFGDGTGPINISGTNINANANNGSVVGITTDVDTNMNLFNNIVAVNTAGLAIGVPILPNGPTNDLGGNQCFLDGVSVPCFP